MHHKSTLVVLKKFGFGKNFQESCAINGGSTTRYFSLQRSAQQGHPISAYVFILCLETLFILTKNDPNIKRIKLLSCYLYTSYAADTTFFLEDENSIVHLSEKARLFSDFCRLKSNTTKCEIVLI